MRRGLPVDLPRCPVDEAALGVAARAEALLTAIAIRIGVFAVSHAQRLAWDEEARGYSDRVRTLHAVASAYAAIVRLRERASGRPGNETLEHRARRVTETLADARARVAAVAADGRAAA